jgi:hypothetical protein
VSDVTWNRTRARIVFLLIVFGSIMMTVALCVVIYVATRPEGDLVGTVPADGVAGVEVALAPGDTVHFRLSYTIAIVPISSFDSNARDRTFSHALAESVLTVVATQAGGQTPLETRCAPYNGRTSTESDFFGSRSLDGALTDCVLTASVAGRYVVRGRIAWSRTLRGSDAVLEVRRRAAQ